MCKTQGERIMAKQKYYAVRTGNKPGVYKTWAECERQTKGVSGAIFKSFATMEEAQRFVAEGTGGTSGEMVVEDINSCLLYTSPSPRDPKTSRMPSSA